MIMKIIYGHEASTHLPISHFAMIYFKNDNTIAIWKIEVKTVPYLNHFTN